MANQETNGSRVNRGSKTHAVILDMARERWGSDNIEIDNDAKVSMGEDNGCFVQAWVWVSFSETELDSEVDA